MGVKPDNWIRSKCMGGHLKPAGWKPMIEPFVDGQVKEVGTKNSTPGDGTWKKVISYGNSSYGYDCRIANEFRVFTNVLNTIVDPKDFKESSFVTILADDYCVIPPNSFALGRTVEWFRIPRDILVIGIGKSTYARCGIILNVTPF